MSRPPRMLIVIPSNRSINMDYLEPLIEFGARFIVVDDTDGSIRMDHPQFEVFNWRDRRKMLGKRDHAIPKRNGASRDFGFYIAWKRSDPGEIIVALDDDCLVYHPDFADRVSQSLSAAPRPIAKSVGRHLNIIEFYDGAPMHLFPRGFPYSARMGHVPCQFDGIERRAPLFCLGLWKGIFDVNAIDKIAGPPCAHPNIEMRRPTVAVASGSLVSVCSMNMQFRREVLPAVYQLPMHVPVMPGWVIDRYGDIWGGFILKTLMDIRGDVMVAGEPMIRHLKEGNVERNTWQEHLCHLVNDEFLAILEKSAARVSSASYTDMMSALNEEFRRAISTCSPLLKGYFEHLTEAIDGWLALLLETC